MIWLPVQGVEIRIYWTAARGPSAERNGSLWNFFVRASLHFVQQQDWSLLEQLRAGLRRKEWLHFFAVGWNDRLVRHSVRHE
jgi:hypothetical protein